MKLFVILMALCALCMADDWIFQIQENGEPFYSARIHGTRLIRTDGKLPKTNILEPMTAADRTWFQWRRHEDMTPAFNIPPRVIRTGNPEQCVYLFCHWQDQKGDEVRYSGFCYLRDYGALRMFIWTQETLGYKTAECTPVRHASDTARADAAALLERQTVTPIPLEGLIIRRPKR